MKSRMTWEEIKATYPDQWVGLSNVKWDGHAPNVASAIVEYFGKTGTEPLKKQIAGEDMYTTYTGKDNMCPLGCLTVMS
ncbi:MAG: hypothetical protein IKN12_08435 [Selenomonadaceae bacterium]|nr:hypothetical protein [Selenomonadaceae bacterium]